MGIEKKKKARTAAAALMMVIIIAFIGIAAVALVTKNSDAAVGYWKIKEVSVFGTVMTEKDAEKIGLSEIGYIRLNRSGSCTLALLGREYEGSWTEADDGTLTIRYGEDKTITAVIKEGVMTAEDGSSAQYKLEK